MIPKIGWTTCRGILRLGLEGVYSTVWSSITLVPPSAALMARPPARAMRSKVQATSAAVSGVPSWNVTSVRRWNRQVLGGTSSQLSASHGWIWKSSSIRTSRS